MSMISDLADAMAAALLGSRHGVALLERTSSGILLCWASPSFYEPFSAMSEGLEEGRPVGRWLERHMKEEGAGRLLSDAGGSCYVKVSGRHWELRSEWLKDDSGAASNWLAFWLQDKTAERLLAKERDSIAKKLSEEQAVDEKSGYLAPKGFWRLAEAEWSLCQRKGESAVLAFISAAPKKGGAALDPLALEDACVEAFSISFRRGGDLIGKVGPNLFAVFVSGQDPKAFCKRFEVFKKALPGELSGLCGASGRVSGAAVDPSAEKGKGRGGALESLKKAKEVSQACLERALDAGEGAVYLTLSDSDAGKAATSI